MVAMVHEIGTVGIGPVGRRVPDSWVCNRLKGLCSCGRLAVDLCCLLDSSFSTYRKIMTRTKDMKTWIIVLKC